MQRNYPDKLKQRRKPAKELDNREGLYLTTGKALTVEERDREVFVELIASRNYYDKGLQLIAKHYGIAASVPKSVIVDFVLPPDGAFWRELALKTPNGQGSVLPVTRSTRGEGNAARCNAVYRCDRQTWRI